MNTETDNRCGDQQKSQGWCPTGIDTSGDGPSTRPWNERVEGRAIGDEDTGTARVGKFDAKLDTRISVGAYGVIVNPVDGSLWGATDEEVVPGKIYRPEKGSNAPETCKNARYMPPKELAYRPGGIDVD